MHIMEGFLPARWALAWTLVAAPFVVYGGYRTAALVRQDTSQKALLAVAAAFVFVLSALKLPSVTGSTTHPTGTGLAVVLFGPAVTAFVSTVVLSYQALLLAHGGVSTLGANVTAMGIVGPVVGWVVYRVVRRRYSLRKATFAAALVADWTTYAVTSLQLGLAFPTQDGVAGVVGATTKFLAIFGVTQLPIGVLEGVLAATLIGYVAGTRTGVRDRLGVAT